MHQPENPSSSGRGIENQSLVDQIRGEGPLKRILPLRFSRSSDYGKERLVIRHPAGVQPVERGMSTVIGVIILVAVVTILSGIVGAVAFSLVDQPEQPPTAVWGAQVNYCEDSDDGTVRIRHENGQDTVKDALAMHYQWDNHTRTEMQKIELNSTGVVQSGDVAHERRIDEPELLKQITLTWEENGQSYILTEFTPSEWFETKSDCFGSEVEPGFVVESNELGGGSACKDSDPTIHNFSSPIADANDDVVKIGKVEVENLDKETRPQCADGDLAKVEFTVTDSNGDVVATGNETDGFIDGDNIFEADCYEISASSGKQIQDGETYSITLVASDTNGNQNSETISVTGDTDVECGGKKGGTP